MTMPALRNPSVSLLGVAAMLLVDGVAWYILEAQKVRPLSDERVTQLRSVPLGSFPIKGEGVPEVIERLNQALAGNEATDDLKIKAWNDAKLPREFRKQSELPRIPGLEPFAGSTKPNDGKADREEMIWASFDHATCYDVLLYAMELSKASLGERRSTIYLVPGVGTFEPILRRSYTIPVQYWQLHRQQGDSAPRIC